MRRGQAEDRSEPWLASALCDQVPVFLMQERGDEAVLWGRRAAEVSEGNPPVHHRARCLLALALVWTYRVREALALLEQLPGPSEQLAAIDLDAVILRGTARLWAGYPELAFPDLSHAAAARLRGGSSARFACVCLTYLACAEYLLGAWDDALAHAELSVSLVRDAGYGILSALVHNFATLVPIGRGDFGLAATSRLLTLRRQRWERRGRARLPPRRLLPWPAGHRPTPSTRRPGCARSGRASGSGSSACSTGVLWRPRPSSRWARSTLLLNVSASSRSSKPRSTA